MKLGALRRILRGQAIPVWKPEALIVGEQTFSVENLVIGVDPGSGSSTGVVVFDRGTFTFLDDGEKLAEHFFPKKPARRRR